MSKRRHLLAVASQNFIDPSACLRGTTKMKDKERSYESMSVCVKPLKRKQAMTAMETGGGKAAERTTRRVNSAIELKRRSVIHLPMRVK